MNERDHDRDKQHLAGYRGTNSLKAGPAILLPADVCSSGTSVMDAFKQWMETDWPTDQGDVLVPWTVNSEELDPTKPTTFD
jgi:hypothetical protein